MRPRLLDLLACPDCQSPFQPEAFRYAEDAVVDGALDCNVCRARYPVINGIPRILRPELLAHVVALHPHFFDTYARSFPGLPAGSQRARSATARTLASFSFQWNTFGQMYEQWEDNFLDYVRPLGPDFFPGKLGLDAGCGFGRHVHYAAKYGAEMVAMDLSDAVEAAAHNNRGFPNIHVIQGDIYNPPFLPNTFDFCYSIGVIHHLPDPPAGFRSLTRFVKPGGTMSVWIYGPRVGLAERITVALRRRTTTMEYGNLYRLCWVIAATLRLSSHLPYRLLSSFGRTRGLAQRLPFHGYAEMPFRTVIADAFDRLSVPLVRYYTAPEIRAWFEADGFDAIQLHRRFLHNESWRALGIKPTNPGAQDISEELRPQRQGAR